LLGFSLFFRDKLGHGWHALAIITLLFACFLFLTALTPYPFLRLLRGKSPPSLPSSSPTSAENEHYFCQRDIVYDSAYPCNRFDLYTLPKNVALPVNDVTLPTTDTALSATENTTAENTTLPTTDLTLSATQGTTTVTTTTKSERLPVFLFVHGGGFCGGDKGRIASAVPYMLQKLTKAGFAVVSTNYAVAPEYPYPTPLYQLTELVVFLRKHERELGLDMTRVALGGESSGGQVAGQFAALQTNPRFAQEMGIEAVLAPSQVKAVYFGCALFDPARFSHTGLSAVADYPLFQMGRGYFRTNSPRRNPQIEQANVFTRITPAFPPTYITDGNFATFDGQAREMVRCLQAAGVACEAFLHDRADGFLPHGYDLYDGAKARENADRLTKFLAEQFA
jgi:acetyl esterase/lipase